MILIPASGKTHETFLYEDSDDPALRYVDCVVPQWISTDGGVVEVPERGKGMFVNEIAFGMTGSDSEAEKMAERAGQRWIPMPWESSDVFVWAHQFDLEADRSDVRMLCSGKTSGYGMHNCVLQAQVQSLRHFQGTLVAATWLECPARVSNVIVDANIGASDVCSALREFGVKDTVVRGYGLAYVITEVLKHLHHRKLAAITVRAEGVSPSAFDSVRDQVFCEWAHRLVCSVGSPADLARPLGEFSLNSLSESLDLTLRWRPGDQIRLRAFRCHRMKGLPVQSGGHGVGQARLKCCAGGDWSSFDFVSLKLRGDRCREDITLHSRSSDVEILTEKGGLKQLQVDAVGMVSGTGQEVALKPSREGDMVKINLPLVEERKFLVKAERTWLESVGRLEVRIARDRFLKLIEPADGRVVLDPGSGDLKKVSAVVRGIMSKGEEVPFRFTVSLNTTHEVEWSADVEQGEIVVSSENLPQVNVFFQGEYEPESIELALLEGGKEISIGRKDWYPDSESNPIWIVPEGSSEIAARCCYSRENDIVVTGWQRFSLETGRSIVVRGLVRREVVFLATAESMEVEVARVHCVPGESRVVTIEKATPLSLNVFCDSQSPELAYRARSVVDGEWGAWKTTSKTVEKL